MILLCVDLDPGKIDWHSLEEEAATCEVGPRASEPFPITTKKIHITGDWKLKAVVSMARNLNYYEGSFRKRENGEKGKPL